MVSFDLSDEQRMIRETVAAFANDEIRPAARLADESGSIPAALIAKSWELGLVRGAIPEQFGGYGDPRSAVTGAIVAEELAFGDLSIALHVLAPRLLACPVIEMGTDDQRARWLKPLAGDNFAAASAALIEPKFDFDPVALETVARRDGRDFVLDGIKCMVPLAAGRGPDPGLCGVGSRARVRRCGRVYAAARHARSYRLGAREEHGH